MFMHELVYAYTSVHTLHTHTPEQFILCFIKRFRGQTLFHCGFCLLFHFLLWFIFSFNTLSPSTPPSALILDYTRCRTMESTRRSSAFPPPRTLNYCDQDKQVPVFNGKHTGYIMNMILYLVLFKVTR